MLVRPCERARCWHARGAAHEAVCRPRSGRSFVPGRLWSGLEPPRSGGQPHDAGAGRTAFRRHAGLHQRRRLSERVRLPAAAGDGRAVGLRPLAGQGPPARLVPLRRAQYRGSRRRTGLAHLVHVDPSLRRRRRRERAAGAGVAGGDEPPGDDDQRQAARRRHEHGRAADQPAQPAVLPAAAASRREIPAVRHHDSEQPARAAAADRRSDLPEQRRHHGRRGHLRHGGLRLDSQPAAVPRLDPHRAAAAGRPDQADDADADRVDRAQADDVAGAGHGLYRAAGVGRSAALGRQRQVHRLRGAVEVAARGRGDRPAAERHRARRASPTCTASTAPTCSAGARSGR